MKYEDVTIIRLADPVSRADMFDDLALQQILNAAYDTGSMPVDGPFKPIFSEFRLGFNVQNLGKIDGGWNTVGSSERIEARFQVLGIGSSVMPRIDALWRGEIIARTVPITSKITTLEMGWPSVGTIDAEIEAALGSLPTDKTILEQERRTRFLTHVRTNLNQPNVFTGETLDKWLESIGAESVSDLLTRFQGTVHSGGVQVTFSPPDPTPPLPKSLPIAAILLIRDKDLSITQLLMESKLIREQLESQGLERSPDSSLTLRHPLLVVWIVPISLFDDADWPGGGAGLSPQELQTARRILAGQWLAREGIGLVVTT